jgi:hypothetical protein
VEVLKWLQKRDYMLEFMKNALESLRDRARKCVNLALKALLRLQTSESQPSPPEDRLKEPVKPPKKAKKHERRAEKKVARKGDGKRKPRKNANRWGFD